MPTPLPADLSLNSEGRELLCTFICEICGLNPNDSNHGDAGTLLNSLLSQWRHTGRGKHPNALYSLAAITFPKNLHAQEECVRGLYLIAGQQYDGFRNIDIDTHSVDRHRGAARHLNFIRGDLVGAAIVELAERVQNQKPEKKEPWPARTQPRKPKSSATKTLQANKARQLLETLLADEIGELKKNQGDAADNPATWIDTLVQARGYTREEFVGCLIGHGIPVRQSRYYSNYLIGKAGKDEKLTLEVITAMSDIIKGLVPSPFLPPEVTAQKLAIALDYTPPSSGLPANPEAIIFDFMKKYRLMPSRVIALYRNASTATAIERYDGTIEARLATIVADPDSHMFRMEFRESTVDSLIEALLAAKNEIANPQPSKTATKPKSPIKIYLQKQIGPAHVVIRGPSSSSERAGLICSLDAGHSTGARYFFTVPSGGADDTVAQLEQFMAHTASLDPPVAFQAFNHAFKDKLAEMGLVSQERGHSFEL